MIRLNETFLIYSVQAYEHFGVIYRRFIKQCYGWKIATRAAFGPLYGLSVLKENIALGFN